MTEAIKKVLYVHHAGSFGGAPKSMSYIIKNLDQKKYQSKLVNITQGPINDFFRKELAVPLEVVKGMRPFHGSTVTSKSLKLFVKNYLFLIPSLIKAYKIVKEENPDLIHLNSTCLLVFSIVGKMLNVPVIVHVREPLRKGIWGAPLRFFNKKNVSGIIAISNFDLRSMRIESQKPDNEVIYNFVEKFSSKGSNSVFRNSLGIQDEDIVFLYLARFAKGNGWEKLIKMGSKLVEKNPKMHFVLAGADSFVDLDRYKSNNIHILPFSPDIDGMLNAADVFVCPFTEPHFARGIIEASAFSLPIIGAHIGGVDELIIHEKTGFLYKDENEFFVYAESLANDSRMRTAMGNEGFLFAKEKFEINKNLAATYAFYDKVLTVNQSSAS